MQVDLGVAVERVDAERRCGLADGGDGYRHGAVSVVLVGGTTALRLLGELAASTLADLVSRLRGAGRLDRARGRGQLGRITSCGAQRESWLAVESRFGGPGASLAANAQEGRSMPRRVITYWFSYSVGSQQQYDDFFRVSM